MLLTMGTDTSHYEGALLEEMNDRLQKVQEALGALKHVPADIRRIKNDLAEMKEWRGIAELVIKDQSKTLNKHEIRLTRLEAA